MYYYLCFLAIILRQMPCYIAVNKHVNVTYSIGVIDKFMV